VQAPFWQVSAPLQALPSPQGVLSGSSGEGGQAPFVQVARAWQGGGAGQTIGIPSEQVPFWQVSAPLQASPSLQGVLLGSAGGEDGQAPPVQVPRVWQASVGAGQTTAVPCEQEPFWQVSPLVQPSPSLQEVLLGSAGGGGQAPFVQVARLWQAGGSGQTSAIPCEQEPFWQVSAPLQALPSLQEVLLGSAGEGGQAPFVQIARLWQGAGSGQASAVPCEQEPFWQVSAPLQALPSLQEVLLGSAGEGGQAPFAQIARAWQGAGSGQTKAVPCAQEPFWQVSAPLQALPSLQEVLLGSAGGSGQTPFVQVARAWQAGGSGQILAIPTQVAVAVQASPVVQALLSLQVMPVRGVWTQVPARQLSAVQALTSAQLVVQVPQWAMSEDRSKQTVPHLTVPGAHTRVQAPFTQVRPEAHMLAAPVQAPQWPSSLARLVQTPPQLVRPAPQQTPVMHVPPAPQVPVRLAQVQLEAAVHARHRPLQAPAQHLPAMQLLETQSVPLTQLPPFGCLMGGAQFPFVQTRPAPQAAEIVWHVPVALQVIVVRMLLAPHTAAPQALPLLSRAQAPLPLQPFEHASSRQAPVGSAPPSATLAQVPSWPRTAQDLHVPVQGPAQHRP
jgi:hypothetical protein